MTAMRQGDVLANIANTKFKDAMEKSRRDRKRQGYFIIYKKIGNRIFHFHKQFSQGREVGKSIRRDTGDRIGI